MYNKFCPPHPRLIGVLLNTTRDTRAKQKSLMNLMCVKQQVTSRFKVKFGFKVNVFQKLELIGINSCIS